MMFEFDDAILHLRTGSSIPYTGQVNVKKGYISLITGENGSGKSLSLGAMASICGHSGLSSIRKITGNFRKPNSDLSGFVSLVRQDPHDNFIGATAADEMPIIASNRGLGTDKIKSELNNILRQFDLSHEILTRPYGKLSGGERQKLAIAFSVIGGTNLVLMDEPTDRLDEDNIKLFLSSIETVLNDRSLVIATHEPEFFASHFGLDKCLLHNVERLDKGIFISPQSSSELGDKSNYRSFVHVNPMLHSTMNNACSKKNPGNITVWDKSVTKELAVATQWSLHTGLSVIAGRNGSGKTLLARCLAGELVLNANPIRSLLQSVVPKGDLTSVVLSKFGFDVPAEQLRSFHKFRNDGLSAYVPAEPSLCNPGEKTVLEELGQFGSYEELEKKITFLESRGIDKSKRINQLSYGQKKLTAIVSIPKRFRLMVIDEPFSGLSRSRQTDVLSYLISNTDLSSSIVVTINKVDHRNTCLSQ